MRIQSNGLQALQMIRAQQAFKAQGVEAPAQEPALPEIPVAQAPVESLSLRQRQQLPLQDIKAVAARAGFLGLEDSDIERALLTGTSLLTDYRA